VRARVRRLHQQRRLLPGHFVHSRGGQRAGHLRPVRRRRLEQLGWCDEQLGRQRQQWLRLVVRGQLRSLRAAVHDCGRLLQQRPVLGRPLRRVLGAATGRQSVPPRPWHLCPLGQRPPSSFPWPFPVSSPAPGPGPSPPMLGVLLSSGPPSGPPSGPWLLASSLAPAPAEFAGPGIAPAASCPWAALARGASVAPPASAAETDAGVVPEEPASSTARVPEASSAHEAGAIAEQPRIKSRASVIFITPRGAGAQPSQRTVPSRGVAQAIFVTCSFAPPFQAQPRVQRVRDVRCRAWSCSRGAFPEGGLESARRSSPLA
jgi:hypothetical protein